MGTPFLHSSKESICWGVQCLRLFFFFFFFFFFNGTKFCGDIERFWYKVIHQTHFESGSPGEGKINQVSIQKISEKLWFGGQSSGLLS